MNAASSRSHAVLQLAIEQSKSSLSGQDKASNSTETSQNAAHSLPDPLVSAANPHPDASSPTDAKRSILTIIDLAGSERVSKSKSTGVRLEEAKKINKSIAALGNCVAALTGSNGLGYASSGRARGHVPFRDSKLTRLLTDSLGGNARTALCTNVGPNPANYDETYSSLIFATRAMAVQNKAHVNRVTDAAELSVLKQLSGKCRAADEHQRAQVLRCMEDHKARQEAQAAAKSAAEEAEAAAEQRAQQAESDMSADLRMAMQDPQFLRIIQAFQQQQQQRMPSVRPIGADPSWTPPPAHSTATNGSPGMSLNQILSQYGHQLSPAAKGVLRAVHTGSRKLDAELRSLQASLGVGHAPPSADSIAEFSPRRIQWSGVGDEAATPDQRDTYRTEDGVEFFVSPLSPSPDRHQHAMTEDGRPLLSPQGGVLMSTTPSQPRHTSRGDGAAHSRAAAGGGARRSLLTETSEPAAPAAPSAPAAELDGDAAGMGDVYSKLNSFLSTSAPSSPEAGNSSTPAGTAAAEAFPSIDDDSASWERRESQLVGRYARIIETLQAEVSKQQTVIQTLQSKLHSGDQTAQGPARGVEQEVAAPSAGQHDRWEGSTSTAAVATMSSPTGMAAATAKHVPEGSPTPATPATRSMPVRPTQLPQRPSMAWAMQTASNANVGTAMAPPPPMGTPPPPLVSEHTSTASHGASHWARAALMAAADARRMAQTNRETEPMAIGQGPYNTATSRMPTTTARPTLPPQWSHQPPAGLAMLAGYTSAQPTTRTTTVPPPAPKTHTTTSSSLQSTSTQRRGYTDAMARATSTSTQPSSQPSSSAAATLSSVAAALGIATRVTPAPTPNVITAPAKPSASGIQTANTAHAARPASNIMNGVPALPAGSEATFVGAVGKAGHNTKPKTVKGRLRPLGRASSSSTSGSAQTSGAVL